MTPVSVDSALQRAHKAIQERVPAQTQQATLRALGNSELRQIVNRFADAWERNDVDAVVAMLADNARMTMSPWPSWYKGRDAIATFLRSWPLSLRERWHLLRTGANDQPAVAGYLLDEQTTAFRPETIIVLTFQAARIEEITAFRSPELFPRFGLPGTNRRRRGDDCACADTSQSPRQLGGTAVDRGGRSLTSRVHAELAALESTIGDG